ncbi:pirin family protein [Leminorella grimontii]|uniref:pirin family protein n=1 Tax=Leminorella grimontii TaxID=82981 RepID=UPI00321F7BF5
MPHTPTPQTPDLQRIASRTKDVGGIPVARGLPVKERRLIGAWCFLDHAGPAVFQSDAQSMHVAPHPHTGLQTFTWMLEGEILHRDSLGYEQVIRPGQVNLMTAGRGISHSEDSVPGCLKLHAAQLWIALPEAVKDMPPRFDHYPNLPKWQDGGVGFTLLTGEFFGRRAPTLGFSELVGVDVANRQKATLTLPLRRDFEYGLFILEGEAQIGKETFAQNELAYIDPDHTELPLTLAENSRVLLLGGEPLGEEVLMWWNFVGRSKEELRNAVEEWNAGSARFGTVPNAGQPPTPAPTIP